MAKKVTGFVKLQIAAGKATPAPPVGPALGQAQINIMEFCKQFNARTNQKEMEGLIIPVVVSVYSDRSFTFITKTPPASILLKRAAEDAKSKCGLGRHGDQEHPRHGAVDGNRSGWVAPASGRPRSRRACPEVQAEGASLQSSKSKSPRLVEASMSGGRRGKKNEKRRKEYRQGARVSRKAPLYAAGCGSAAAESQICEV